MHTWVRSRVRYSLGYSYPTDQAVVVKISPRRRLLIRDDKPPRALHGIEKIPRLPSGDFPLCRGVSPK